MDSPVARSTRLLVDLLEAKRWEHVQRAFHRWESLPIAEQTDLLSHTLGGLYTIVQRLAVAVPGVRVKLTEERDALLILLLQVDLEGLDHVS